MAAAQNMVVVDASIADLSQMVPTGTSVYVEGLLENPPKVSKKKIELQVEKVIDVGLVEPAKDLVHLQPGKNTIAAVARIRSALAYATRTFFYCIDCLRMVASAPFEPMTYTKEVELLEESEHERCLTEVNQKPLIVYNYPQGIKAFYMRLTDDLETLAAADRFDLIKSRMEEMGLPFEPHECGFGLGFDWMMIFATGMDNIRDVLPFPRYHGIADP
ncbi:Asparagine--tRNA ligase cytoplasmic 1 [Citrus sinensis]|uniref:Asparagine--tRNA ligase cytoplasmic 1 n=1 Tax=Citrus sinensis TaxID=2711 RepID=A0ACB8ITR3_CITSI|nr:Asparagine--tRNA ligase cytoplasmic 1 [Citrus sinensis]